ncbi:MAG: (2Fe-2S)-binding protein [Actinomycetota bacterium]
MLICHCRAVTDRMIRAQIRAGARSEDDVKRGCGAGGRCGACLPTVRRLLMQSPVQLVASR